MRTFWMLIVVLGLALSACDGESSGTDGGLADAGMRDGAVSDAGGSDAGAADAAAPAPACLPSGLSCEPSEYCDRGVGRCRGPGGCYARPQTCSDPASEVCGCDGVTYASTCEAFRAGASIAAEGPC